MFPLQKRQDICPTQECGPTNQQQELASKTTLLSYLAAHSQTLRLSCNTTNNTFLRRLKTRHKAKQTSDLIRESCSYDITLCTEKHRRDNQFDTSL